MFLQVKARFAQIFKVSGSTCLRDQRCSSKVATKFPWELRDAVDPDLKEGMGTVVDLCNARENLLCLLEIFCLMPRTKFGSDTMLNISIDTPC